jgi:hypothetical protein
LRYCRKKRWTKEGARSSSVRRLHRFLEQLLSRELCPSLRLHVVLRLLQPPLTTNVPPPSIHPLMTSSPRCGPTVELMAFAFDVVTNGLQAIVVLRFLRYMHSKRYGTFMQMLFKKVLLLNLLKKSKLPLNKHLCCCRRLLSLVLLLQEQCSCKAPCLDVISAF